MIRVVLPAHLRTLARVDGEVTLELAGAITQGAVLDALEGRYPVLRGTMRDHVTHKRRAYIRFFACERDLSHEPARRAAAGGGRYRRRAVSGRRRNGRRLIRLLRFAGVEVDQLAVNAVGFGAGKKG